MSELTMMEAALFQLRAALDDDPALMPIRLGADVLSNAIIAAKGGLNPARVNDIEFALNDLVAAIDDAGAPEGVYGPMAMLQNDAAALRAATMLPPDLVASVRALQAKLRERSKAMERAQFQAGGMAEATLPHSGAVLRDAAIPLARQLAAAGFETPALDTLIADPDELRYHMLNEIVDELDVIAR